MPRSFGRIDSSIWEDAAWRKLDAEAQRLLIYLRTSRHGNIIGCFRMPPVYVQEDTGWRLKAINDGLQTLAKPLESPSEPSSNSGVEPWIVRDPDTQWVLINRFLEWEPLQNRNQASGAVKLFATVPHALKLPLYKAITKHCQGVEWPSGDPFGTLIKAVGSPSKPIPTIDMEQDQFPSQVVEPGELVTLPRVARTREGSR